MFVRYLQPRTYFVPATLRHASDFASSFKAKATNKLQLKEFYKFTHPDVFGSAPKTVSAVNAESIQSLNSYLQAVQSLSAEVQGSKLKFFVAKQTAEKQEGQESSESDFSSFSVELLPLRADSSYALRQQHYATAVETLAKALDDVIVNEQAEDSESMAKKLGLENFEAQFNLSWDKTIKKEELKNPDKVLTEMQRSWDTHQLLTTRKQNLIHEQVRKKAMMNVYRKKYDIPEDLMVRKPDHEIRMALNDSEAVQKVQRMAERSIHPSLIFFEKDLDDHLA